MIREAHEITVNDVHEILEDIQLTIDLMERRQERIEQVTAITFTLLAFIFLLTV